MKFDPKNVKERPDFEYPEIGLCKVKIVDSADKISKRGNDMIELKIEVLAGQKGEGYPFFEYIVDNEWKDTKIDNILRACGLGAKLDAVQNEVDVTTQSFVGLKGTVMLKNEEYKGVDRPKIHYWVTEESNGIAAEVEKAMNIVKPTAARQSAPLPGTKTVDGVQTRADDEDDIPF